MKHVLTKETLIDRVLRPIGTIIDGIATPGEIESLLFVGRARRVPDPQTDDHPDEPEPVDEIEAEDLEPEPVDEIEPEDLEPEPVDEIEPEDLEPEPVDETEPEDLEPEPIDETELQQEPIDDADAEDLEAADDEQTAEASELESWVRGQGLPANVFDSLYDAGIRSMEQLGDKLAQDGYRLSTVNGIGPKTEARIRDAFTA